MVWLQSRLDALVGPDGAPSWHFALTELAILAKFYQRCSEQGFAVFADGGQP